mgnify:FL=1
MKERPTGQGGKKMVKYFELQQTNGNSTTVVIVVDPVIENGSIRATLVGKLNGFSDDGECTFIKCEPADIIAIGNVICTEVKNPFAE